MTIDREDEPFFTDLFRQYAKCAGMYGVFFPEDERGPRVAYPKSICHGLDGEEPCPIREACLEYALENKEQFGVWGGYTTRERMRIQNKRLRAQAEEERRGRPESA